MAVIPGDYLADTNVLLRLSDPKAPLHALVTEAIWRILAAGNVVHIAPQNLIEFWNVVTRPLSANGFGLTPTQAATRVRALQGSFPVLDETPALYFEWERLAEAAQVSGKQVHDTRLVAYMSLHGIPNLLTLNPADFHRFTPLVSITIVEPKDV